MKKIRLSQGDEALVDDEDYYHLSKSKWYLIKKTKAIASMRLKGDGPYIMCRVIMGLTQGDPRVVIHLNRNKLDNRKSNLAIGTYADAAHYQPVKPSRGSSRYKGVMRRTFETRTRYVAQIEVDYKNLHLGTFESEQQAARAYNHAAEKYFGRFAVLNPV